MCGWQSSDEIVFGDPLAPSTTFTMPNKDVVITAIFENLFDITVVAGQSGSISAIANEVVEINAYQQDSKVFFKWDGGDQVEFFDQFAPSTTFVMPAKSVTITAIFKDVYSLIVQGGVADKPSATEGEVISITAAEPPTGKIFDKWQSANDVIFEEQNQPSTSFVMPDYSVEIALLLLILSQPKKQQIKPNK